MDHELQHVLLVDFDRCNPYGIDNTGCVCRLAELIAAEGRACVVVVNKWDAVPNKETNTLRDFEADLKAQLRPIDWALVVFTSATTGQRVSRILDAVAAAAEQHRCACSHAKLVLCCESSASMRRPYLSQLS